MKDQISYFQWVLRDEKFEMISHTYDNKSYLRHNKSVAYHTQKVVCTTYLIAHTG